MVQVISYLFSIIERIISVIVEIVFSFVSAISSKDRGTEYTAEFVSPGSILSIFNLGYALAGGLRATTREIAFRNSLIVGPSGSGKTSTVLIGSICTLARGNSSMCIMDVSGELFKLTSGWLEKIGYTIYCIDFGATSDSFNCLALCTTITDVQKIAFLLIKNSGIESKSDPYWSASAEMMAAVFIEYLVFHAPPEFCNMANLVRLTDTFAGSPSKVDVLFVKTRSPELIAKYKAMNAVSEKTLQSTLATVRTALKVFGTPAIRHCTATNTIDFASFRKTKSVLYICTPLNDVNYYAPLSALLFEALFKEIMSRIPDKGENSIFCLIDEMVTMKFQNLGIVYANCRKYFAGCMGIIQDEKMLEMGFSPAEAHAIRTNSYSKVYLPGQPLATCKQLEEILGKYTYLDEKSNSEKTRLLMSASEVRMSKEAIILVGNEPPIKAKTISYYNHWKLKQRTKIPPYVPDTKIQTDDPPLIPFD